MPAKKQIVPSPTPRLSRGRPVRRLYVVRGDGVWHLRQGRTITDTYETRRDAVDGARAIARQTKAEIFVDGYNGRHRQKIIQSSESDEFFALMKSIHDNYNSAGFNGGAEPECQRS